MDPPSASPVVELNTNDGQGRGRRQGGRGGRRGTGRGRGRGRGRGGQGRGRGPALGIQAQVGAAAPDAVSGMSRGNPQHEGNANVRESGSRGRGRGRGSGSGSSAVSKNGLRGGSHRTRGTVRPQAKHQNRPTREAKKFSSDDTSVMPPQSRTELASRLSELMLRGQVECCICLERVKREHALWSCKVCFTIVHLACAKRWARRVDPETGQPCGFACPSCRAPVSGSARSLQFWCYCGRQKNPVLEAGLVPGSCGEMCGKSKGMPGSDCPHTCSDSLCHPGPCHPCERPGSAQTCHCGKEEVPRKCGQLKPLAGTSCSRACGLRLECGHACLARCHPPGACAECMVPCTMECHCGRTTTELPCALSVDGHSCGETCGKLKSCGNHICEEVCHPGSCPPCEFDSTVVKTCSCGARSLTTFEKTLRKSCMDPIPSCGAPCNRPLGCLGGHACQDICGHDGKCTPCRQTVQAFCRCGASVSSCECGAPPEKLRELLVCTVVCNDRLTCKKHKCGRQCCPYRKRKALIQDSAVSSIALFGLEASTGHARSVVAWRRDGHSCTEVCNRTLQCSLHSCDAQCGHQYDCPPCGLLIREGISCECGAERIPAPVRCGTAPPPCSRRCSKLRTTCSHPCPDPCHSGPCPPCVELVRKECVGKHGEARFVLCHVGGPDGIRCHRACGRPLRCGMHACRNECHGNFPEDCEPSDPRGCTQICGLPRECGHGCASPCHPDEIACPETPCMANVTIRCRCGRLTESAPCLRGGARGQVPLGSDGLIRLQCDDQCEEMRRLTAFASALGTTPTTLTSMRKVGKTTGGYVGEDGVTVFSPFLLDFASREYATLSFFERELGSIVSGKTRRVDFGTMPQLYRAVLHCLSELYFLDSESTGKSGVKRLVVLHRGAGTKPVSPVPLLSEAYAQQCVNEKMQNSPQQRSLVVFVPGSPRLQHLPDLSARVERELAPHAGNFKILGSRDLGSGVDKLGAVVEFSTVARMELVRSVLSAKPGVVVCPLVTTRIRPPNSRLGKPGMGEHSSGSSSAQMFGESSGWGPSDGPRSATGYASGSGGSRSLLLQPRPSIDPETLRNAPESWEDT